MKISVLGIPPFSNLIQEGFEKLGHEISNENPKLIFSNDPRGYEEAILMKKKYPKAFVIFNILDIPWHMTNIEMQTKLLVNNFLIKADIVTAISFKVKRDLSKFLDKKIHVIYNPVQEVYCDNNIKKDRTFLYVGRANDPIKRINLVYDSLIQIKHGVENLKICGSQNPGFGNYLGVASLKELNQLYNSSKFVFLPSKAEGIGLPMIEAMICGTLPIVCSDNETAREFLPSDFICEPDSKSIVNKIKELEEQYNNKRKIALKFGKKYKDMFSKINIAQNILNLKK